MISRDLRLDSLRGILLVIMTFNHLRGDISQLTSEPFGFVSAAEGFVLLSAYTAAITWKRDVIPFTSMLSVGFRRAWKIYKYHAVLLLFLGSVALASNTYARYWEEMFFTTDASLLHTISAGLVLVHQPMFCDILPMYVIFSLATPFLLRALQSGYIHSLLLASAVVWLFGQWVHPIPDMDMAFEWDVRTGLFNLLSWQLLWVVGLVIGFMHAHQGINFSIRHPGMIATAFGLVLVCFLVRHEIYALPTSILPHFQKPTIGVLRLLNVCAQLILALYILTALPRSLNLPWFSSLGRYSLQVFTYHVFIIYLTFPATWRFSRMGSVAEIAFHVAIVASLTIPVWLYGRYGKYVPRSLSLPKSNREN
jgi:hypothetical protein